MSQIALFTYLKESEVPFLGFWSKPKARLFRKPESNFGELLRQHTLRESIFEAADGVYVALVFAWLEIGNPEFSSEADPVLETVRRQASGSYWLIKSRDLHVISLLMESLPEGDWSSFLRKVGIDERSYAGPFFESARRFVIDRLSELKPGEALLVSVG